MFARRNQVGHDFSCFSKHSFIPWKTKIALLNKSSHNQLNRRPCCWGSVWHSICYANMHINIFRISTLFDQWIVMIFSPWRKPLKAHGDGMNIFLNVCVPPRKFAFTHLSSLRVNANVLKYIFFPSPCSFSGSVSSFIIITERFNKTKINV